MRVSFVKSLITKINTALFPDNICCIFCDRDMDVVTRTPICKSCSDRLPYNNGKICMKCGKPLYNNICDTCLYTSHEFIRARAAFVYSGIMMESIHRYKIGGAKYLAKYYADWMYIELVKSDFVVDAICSVPLHITSLRRRHYNQSQELLIHLNKILQLPDLSSYLIKTRNTRKQASLSRDDRIDNLVDCFEVIEKGLFKNKSILLIDDIFTTGTTVNTISALLKRSGAKCVYVLTLAHGSDK